MKHDQCWWSLFLRNKIKTKEVDIIYLIILYFIQFHSLGSIVQDVLKDDKLLLERRTKRVKRRFLFITQLCRNIY